jgi:hypothetical protein
MDRKKAFLSSLAVGILVFVLVVMVVGPEEFIQRLTSVQPEFLFVAFLTEVFAVLLLALRWKWFVDASGHETRFKDIALISIVGQALNSITPAARMGGEPVRAYLLKKRTGVPIESGMASVVVEKITDVAAFCFIVFLALVYAVYVGHPWHVIALLLASLAFAFSVIFALFYVSFLNRIESHRITGLMDKYKGITDRLPLVSQYKNRLRQNLDSYYWSVNRIANTRDAWTVGILFSLGYWLMEVLRAYILFVAFTPPGQEMASAALIVSAIVISTIAGSVPFLPGGLGVVEGTMIVIYSTSNISSVTAGLVTLIDRLLSYWLVILVGLPMAWYLGVASRGEDNGN